MVLICVKCSQKLPMVIITVLTNALDRGGVDSRDSVYGMLLGAKRA
jgi:hypothetical protein